MLGKKKSTRSARQPHLNGGTQNQPVFSYRAARSGTDRQFERGLKPGSKASSLRRKLKNLPYILSFAAVGAALLYNLTLTPNAQIVVSGDQVMLRPKESYQQAINATLKSSLANRTKITINTDRVSSQIRRQFPEIETLAISLPLLRHEPIIEIKLAAPAALLAASDKVHVLDSNGRVLFERNQAKPGFDMSKLPVIADPSGHQIVVGSIALTSSQILYAKVLISQAAAKQLQPESMTLSAGGEELHLRFQGIGYAVKFSFGADSRQSFGAFLATKERVEQERAEPAEYIDVRIPERSYVK